MLTLATRGVRYRRVTKVSVFIFIVIVNLRSGRPTGINCVDMQIQRPFVITVVYSDGIRSGCNAVTA